MFKTKSSKPQLKIESLIGEDTVIEGNILFTGGLRIDGVVKGNVCSTDEKVTTLELSENAKIEGQIRVSHAMLNGTVVGPVFGSEFVELLPKSKVTGDVHYNNLEIHLGALIQGNLVHEEKIEEEPQEKKQVNS